MADDAAEEARRERRRELARAAYRRRVLRERYPGVSDAEAERRAKLAAAARTRALREAHPGVAREQAEKLAADKRYRRKHAAKIREKHPAAQARRRDKDPDAFRAKARETYWNDVDKAAARYQRWYQANLEKAREAARNRARLKKRLERLGLPPRRLARVYAETRRANLATADAFFDRHVTVGELARASREHSSPTFFAAWAWTRAGGQTPDELLDRHRVGLRAYRSWHAERHPQERPTHQLPRSASTASGQTTPVGPDRLEQRSRERALVARSLVESGMPTPRLGIEDPDGVAARAQEARDFFRSASASGYRRRVIAARRRLMADESPTPQALIDRFRLANEVVRLQGAQRNEALKLRAGFDGIVERRRARLEPAIAEEARLDSIARVIRGAEPLDVAAETERRLRQTVFDTERDAAQRRAVSDAHLTWQQDDVQQLLRLNRATPERLEDAIERMTEGTRATSATQRRQRLPPPELER